MLLAPVRPLRIANLPTWQEAAIPQGRWLKHNEQKPLVLNRANVDKKGKYQTNCASLPQWPAPAYAHKCHYCLMCRAAPLSHIQIKQHYMSTCYEQHEQNVEGAAIDNKSRRQPFFFPEPELCIFLNYYRRAVSFRNNRALTITVFMTVKRV